MKPTAASDMDGPDKGTEAVSEKEKEAVSNKEKEAVQEEAIKKEAHSSVEDSPEYRGMLLQSYDQCE